MALATFAISAASTGVGFMAQEQQAKQQDAAYAQNKKNSIAAFEDSQRALTYREAQEQESAAVQKQDNNIQARKAAATNIVAAGESGITGNTVDSLLRDIYGQAGAANDRVDQNLDWSMEQIAAEKRGQGFTAQNRINSVQRGQKPSIVAAGLKLAGAGLDSYTGYKKATK